MKQPRLQVDFNEYDRASREIPVPPPSVQALERAGLAIRDGLLVQLYSPDLDDAGKPADLVVEGRLRFDAEVGLWTACVNPETFRHQAPREQVH